MRQHTSAYVSIRQIPVSVSRGRFGAPKNCRVESLLYVACASVAAGLSQKKIILASRRVFAKKKSFCDNFFSKKKTAS
jgi:hypothetical protein